MCSTQYLGMVAPGYENDPNAETWLEEGVRQHAPPHVFGNAYCMIIACWAAHHIWWSNQVGNIIEDGEEDGIITLPSGPVAQQTAGSEMLGFSTRHVSSALESEYTTTPFGRKYLAMIARANARGTVLPGDNIPGCL